jgi:hypothetical protein
MGVMIYVTSTNGVEYEIPFSDVKAFMPMKNKKLLIVTNSNGVILTRISINSYIDTLARLFDEC